MSIQLTNAEWLVLRAAADAVKPPPPVDHLTWAEENVAFGKESPFPGPYNRKLFPFFDRILEVLAPDHPCREVTMRKSAQLGGTVVAQVFAGSTLDQDPCDFLFTHPTEPNAKRWSKLKWKKFLRQSAALRKIFLGRSRDASDSVLYQERTDGLGSITISGANSEASLSMVTMPKQVQDDLAKWEMNAAGDPETQADSRSQAFDLAKIFKPGTPLIMPGCRITRNYKKGTQERFHVPCPHCDHYQPLEWENMLANLEEGKPESAQFTCVACGGVIEQKHRYQVVLRGRWVADNPGAKSISFHLWSAYGPLMSWSRIADAWFKAKGDPEAERVFLNDVVGEAFEFKGEAPPWEDVRDRAEETGHVRGRIPPRILVLTLGLDCQKDRVEWHLVGWGQERRRAVIDYGVQSGHISEEECWKGLDLLLKQTWRNGAGRDIGIDLAAIDGNAWTEDVWEWAKRHPQSKVIMVRGNRGDTAPLLEHVKRERDRNGKIIKWSRRFYNFGASPLKMALYRNLKKTDPMERGHVGLPKGMEDEYFRQLCSEKRVPKRQKTGFIKYEWTKDPSQANEALDSHLQAEAAAIKYGVRVMPDSRWEMLEAEREAPLPDAQLDIEDVAAMNAPGRSTVSASDVGRLFGS